MSFVYKREMTITHSDFFRLLPRALGSNDYTVNDLEVNLGLSNYNVQIKLSEEKSWRIGALSLPKTFVEIIYSGCSEKKSHELIRLFDQTYQKGGG